MLQHFVEMSSICHASCISCTSKFFPIGALQTPSTCWFGLIWTSPLKVHIVESIFLKGINPTKNWFFPPLQNYRSNSEEFFLFNLDSDFVHQTDLVLVMKYCWISTRWWVDKKKLGLSFLNHDEISFWIFFKTSLADRQTYFFLCVCSVEKCRTFFEG